MPDKYSDLAASKKAPLPQKKGKMVPRPTRAAPEAVTDRWNAHGFPD